MQVGFARVRRIIIYSPKSPPQWNRFISNIICMPVWLAIIMSYMSIDLEK